MNRKNKNIYSAAVVITGVAIYLATGIYTIQSGQHASITRFGKAVREVADPGINYRLPWPFERVDRVHVREVRKVHLQSRRGTGIEGFTGDENLIMVNAVVNYDVKNLTAYLYNVSDAESQMESAAMMCLNEQIARLNVDEIMTTGKSVLRTVLKRNIQNTLDRTGVGVRVISVELTDIAPPQDVSESFKAVSNARERKQRIIKEAEGYANTVVPKARGKASSIKSQAQAYAQETINMAGGRVKAFNALYAEYVRKPEITAKLRYLETLKKIYKNCQVTVDANPSQSIYYIGKGGIMDDKKTKNNGIKKTK